MEIDRNRNKSFDTSTTDQWSPNVPFNGTQKEWWDYFHGIEESCFSSISESHQRVSQWLDNQKK